MAQIVMMNGLMTAFQPAPQLPSPPSSSQASALHPPQAMMPACMQPISSKPLSPAQSPAPASALLSMPTPLTPRDIPAQVLPPLPAPLVHSNLVDIDAKLAAVEKEQQGRQPGQSLDSALAKHRKALVAKEKAEAALQKAKQAVIDAIEHPQQADLTLQAAAAHVEAVRQAVAPEASIPKPPPPPCNKIATAVTLKLSAALANARANQATLTDSQVIDLPKGPFRTKNTTTIAK